MIDDAPCWGLSPLPEQCIGCGTEKQELPVAPTMATTLVDLATRYLRQVGDSLNLVENQHAPIMGAKALSGNHQMASVVRIPEIEIRAVGYFSGDCPGWPRLSSLPRLRKEHRGCFREAPSDVTLVTSLDRPCLSNGI